MSEPLPQGTAGQPLEVDARQDMNSFGVSCASRAKPLLPDGKNSDLLGEENTFALQCVSADAAHVFPFAPPNAANA